MLPVSCRGDVCTIRSEGNAARAIIGLIFCSRLAKQPLFAFYGSRFVSCTNEGVARPRAGLSPRPSVNDQCHHGLTLCHQKTGTDTVTVALSQWPAINCADSLTCGPLHKGPGHSVRREKSAFNTDPVCMAKWWLNKGPSQSGSVDD